MAARDYDTRVNGIEISVSDGVSQYCIAAAIVAVNTNLEQLRTGRVPGARDQPIDITTNDLRTERGRGSAITRRPSMTSVSMWSARCSGES